MHACMHVCQPASHIRVVAVHLTRSRRYPSFGFRQGGKCNYFFVFNKRKRNGYQKKKKNGFSCTDWTHSFQQSSGYNPDVILRKRGPNIYFVICSFGRYIPPLSISSLPNDARCQLSGLNPKSHVCPLLKTWAAIIDLYLIFYYSLCYLNLTFLPSPTPFYTKCEPPLLSKLGVG